MMAADFPPLPSCPVTPINAADAWHILCALRTAAAGCPASLEGITMAADGTWHATRPIAQDAAQLLDLLLPMACGGVPCVVAQIGQSLDGYIATANGDSCYVTGMQSRIHLHRLRALVDAVVVGVGTVIADDPALTVRHVTGPNPARVVLDPHGRAPRGARVFTERGATTWHAVCDPAQAAPGASALALPPGDAMATACALLQSLAQRGLRRVLIEGGGITISHFLQAGLLDRLHVMVAPLLLGSGRRTLTLPEIKSLHSALRPRCRSYALGEDRLYDLDLRHLAG
jgi:riboflavin-specific deaminase-like protein